MNGNQYRKKLCQGWLWWFFCENEKGSHVYTLQYIGVQNKYKPLLEIKNLNIEPLLANFVLKFQKSAYMTLQTWSSQNLTIGLKKGQNFMLTSKHEKIACWQVINHWSVEKRILSSLSQITIHSEPEFVNFLRSPRIDSQPGCAYNLFLRLRLKRVWHEIFQLKFFIYESISPGPLCVPLGQ